MSVEQKDKPVDIVLTPTERGVLEEAAKARDDALHVRRSFEDKAMVEGTPAFDPSYYEVIGPDGRQDSNELANRAKKKDDPGSKK